VKDHPVIDQLVKIRTILEKLKPLDQKLKHQVDKLLKLATIGEVERSQDDARNFKPNPDAFGEDEEVEKGENDPNELYKIPKHAEVHFEEKTAAAQKKKVERAEQRVKKSSMMKYIIDEFRDAPEEVSQIGIEEDQDEKEREKEQYEEDNYMRLGFGQPTKKKQRTIKDKFLDDFGVFDKLTNLEKEEQDQEFQDPNLILQKKSMRDIIRNKAMGVEDKPARKRKKNDEVISGSEDEFYNEIANQTKSRKQKPRKDSPREEIEEDDEGEEGGKRGISREMTKNRGLTKSRNKKFKTPKSKNRRKFEKAIGKRRGMVPKPRSQSETYRGERTGINSNVTKSRKFV